MSKKQDAKPTAEQFAGVARAIAGADSSELAANLYECAKLVLAYHQSENMALKRSETREWLRQFARDVGGVLDTLENPLHRHFLDRAGPQEVPVFEALPILNDLLMRARLAAEDIASGGGKGLAYPMAKEGPVTARDLASLVVILAWENQRGKKPGPDNDDALQAAEAYWWATTGRCDSGWRDHFIAAKRLRVAKDARAGLVADIRRSLIRTPVLDLFDEK
jgi:hypothetical protein